MATEVKMKSKTSSKSKKDRPDPKRDRHRIDIAPVFPDPPGEHGIPAELWERGTDAPMESICGEDDSQPVEQYDGTLGVTTQFVMDHERPVGQLQWNSNLAQIYTNPGNVSNVRWCTGTLITNDLFLTAGHCFDQTGGGWSRPKANGTNTIIPPSEIATNMHVNFNYQVDANGNLKQEQSYPILELVEYRINGLDFAVARLGGNPGATWGTTPISAVNPAIGDMLCIIQHPQGLPKRIEAGPASDVANNNIYYDDIDTQGGSSGSGILNEHGRICGVHTNGGCHLPNIGNNRGLQIEAIIAASPTVSGLLQPKFKFADDGVIFKILDDSVFKWFNDGNPVFKKIDDVKAAGYDKHAASDGYHWGFDPVVNPAVLYGGARPTVNPTMNPTVNPGAMRPAMNAGGFNPAAMAGYAGAMAGYAGAGPQTAGPRPAPNQPTGLQQSTCGPQGAAPFVLATPHHSNAWMNPGPNTPPAGPAGRGY